MNGITRIFTVAIGLLVVSSGSLMAQSRHATATNMALGGGGTAYQNGYHANFVNPANLMLDNFGEASFSLGIGGFSASGGGGLANISVYNDYFTTGRSVSGNVAVEALDRWFGTDPGVMKKAAFQVDVVPFGISKRGESWSASVAVRTRSLTSASMNRGLAELYLNGLNSDLFSSERPVNMGMESMTFAEVSAGFGMKLLEVPNLFGIFRDVKLFAGAAPKLLLGTNYSSMEFNSTLMIDRTEQSINELRHDFDYRVQTTGSVTEQLQKYHDDKQSAEETPNIDDYVEPAASDAYEIKGTGFGLDLGATAEMNLDLPVVGSFFDGPERLRVGISLTDLGSISYDKQYGRFAADDMLVWDGLEIDQERVDNEFNGDDDAYYEHVQDSLANEVYGSFSPQGKQSVTRGLPSMFNIGSQLTMNKLSVSLDFGAGFIERGINSKRMSMATGLEYRLFGFLPLRVGMHTGGYSSTSYSAGAGLSLKNLEFTVAVTSVPNSENYGTNIGAAWSGLLLRF